MKNRSVVLALGVMVLWQSQAPSLAAKKYYPPGFTPPSDQKLIPAPAAPAEPAPQIIIQQVPGAKQIIIKTIPVERVKPAKPRDPLTVLLEEHRYYDALRLVDTRLKKSPNNLSLQMMRAQILREDDSYQQATDQYEAILEKNHSPSVKAGAFNGLGWTHYKKALHARQVGDFTGFEAELALADGFFRQASRLSPNLFYAWAGLTKVALANVQLKEAAQWMAKAKRLAPHNITVQLAEAELLLAQKKPEEALQLLYGVKKTTTHEPEVFLLLAKASMGADKLDDAIINLKQMLQMVPENAEGLKLLSQAYELKMKPEDAAQVLEKSIALNPSDVNSVDSLIKIYDQRNHQDRSVLLLKTLLKDQPGQAYYGKLLLARLLDASKWEDAYLQGLATVGPILANPDGTRTEQQAIVNLFSRAIFHYGRGLLNRRDLLKEPAVLKTCQFAEARLKEAVATGEPMNGYDVENRLNLLLIEPLADFPRLPATYHPREAQLSVALQVAFLQGDHLLSERLLQYAQVSPDRLSMASQLYTLGDYGGALSLVNGVLSAPSKPVISESVSTSESASSEPANNTDAVKQQAQVLKQQIEQAQKAMTEQLDSFSMLPGRLSDAYWQKAAIETLRVGNGYWKAHALVAKGLEQRDNASLALIHQQLAAQYATQPKDEKYWRRKAEKNAKKLKLTHR
ncbi:tetratricopeptide repeat protein [Vampirovibrio sp.]|uniref:tetratricopeptide repeat protein n=1 Tax=Vampirovibrio sp. TaxID=2717857 RepID=UPI0035933A0F